MEHRATECEINAMITTMRCIRCGTTLVFARNATRERSVLPEHQYPLTSFNRYPWPTNLSNSC